MASNNGSTKKSLSKRSSAKLTPLLDEDEWVIQIRAAIEEEIEEEDIKTPVSIFCVPQAMVSCKPEAYVPQLFAFGPYHHWRPQLYDMERYKLGAVRRTLARLGGPKFDEIVAQQFLKRDYKIRCHYHKYLDLSPETLAWMMAIDACFLLEFLQNSYAAKQAELQAQESASAAAKSTSKRMEMERRKMGFNMIFRDIAMLENQIPLFILRKLLNLMHPTKDVARMELSHMLIEFVRELSPFTSVDESILTTDDATNYAHLLEVLYRSIVPKSKEPPLTSDITEEVTGVDGESWEKEAVDAIGGDPSKVRKMFSWVWSLMSSMGFIKRVILSRPVSFVFKFPWKVITALPLFRIIKLPVENYLSKMLSKPKSDDDDKSTDGKPPLVEEITIPSVTELVRAGVKFLPTSGDLTTITFDTLTLTMYLPVISLDVNTEVVLRNLVAYEASAVARLVFTRYTELMSGIIDTEEDVKILRGEGIVVNRMKSDGEAAGLWNGMSKSVRLSKVGFLDKAIGDVNKYYGSRWRVKCMNYMRKYIFGSWQILTFLAAGMMLFLTCVQAFCSVYSCSSHWTKISSSVAGGD